MTDKGDFLTSIRDRLAGREDAGKRQWDPESLWVQISVKNYEPMLRLTDALGRPKSAAEYRPTGALGQLIRTLTDIEGRNTMDFSWDEPIADHSFRLADYPFLTSYFAKCAGRLIDGNCKPLLLADDAVSVRLALEPGSGVEPPKARFMAGESEVTAFLGSEMVLAGNVLQRVKDVGPRFNDLIVFTSGFEKSIDELYLSILFSMADNIKVEYEGRKVVFQKEPVVMEPVLAIERIDIDNSLHLRVGETVGNIPFDAIENFRLGRVATVGEKEITVRQLAASRLEEYIDEIRGSLEKNAGKRELKGMWIEGSLFIVPQEIASRFLYNSFAEIITKFRLLGAEKLKKYKIVAAMPRLHVSLGSGIDYLEGEATVSIGEEVFTLRDLLTQYTKQKYISLSDGEKAVVDPGYMKRLQRIFRNAGKGNKMKISFFDLPEVMELLEDKGAGERGFDRCREFYEGFNTLKGGSLSLPGLHARLRGYQEEGVKWIGYLYDNRMGGCLADDMGLGKTVQTIAMLTRCVGKGERPSLIVMPRSLIFNWQEEMRKFAPEIRTVVHYGQNRDFGKSMQGEVILTSYATVRNDIEKFMKEEFEYVILDESQQIKNVEAQTTKAIWLLKGRHRLAISGTPIENNLTELYSLFHFLNPTMFGSLKDFVEAYVNPIQRDGDEETAAALRRKVFPFILRRLKRDVLTDLPERTDQVLTVEMSPRQAALYEERRRYFAGEIGRTIASSGISRASFELLQALMELRQIASVPEEKSNGSISSPKIELLMEYLLNAVRNGHKAVVFFNFLSGIELTARHLDREGIGYETMTGATRDRKGVVERFQNDDDCRVMLMTVKTGGVGLNLVAADTVFIAEPWWNKAAEEQAINRLHRIGQRNAVNCYYLVTAGTIEEKIRLLQKRKAALIDAVITSDSEGGKSLTEEDINYLLS